MIENPRAVGGVLARVCAPHMFCQCTHGKEAPVCRMPVAHRLSEAAIGAAAEELLQDPEGYFARCRALRAKEAEAIVERKINAQLAAGRARSRRWWR